MLGLSVRRWMGKRGVEMSDVKTENLWLMKGDCLERMKEIPDGGVDMVLTSPPYDNLRDYNGVLDATGWG